LLEPGLSIPVAPKPPMPPALSEPSAALFCFSCPGCSFPYSLPRTDVGKKFNCPKCGQRIQVPAPPASQNKTVLGKLPGQTDSLGSQPINTQPVRNRPSTGISLLSRPILRHTVITASCAVVVGPLMLMLMLLLQYYSP